MRRMILWSVCVGAMLGLAGCANDSDTTNTTTNTSTTTGTSTTTAARTPGPESSPGTGASMSPDDRTFAEEAANGGLAEVQLGQLAVKNAKGADVKQFGQKMIDDHTKANNELKQILAKKSITPPAELNTKNKELYDRLSKLTGDQFDKAYMAAMVEDHTKDVADFEKKSNDTTGDADIKAFATKTLPTLKGHLQMAKDTEAKESKEK
jgi:putative membrane protein